MHMPHAGVLIDDERTLLISSVCSGHEDVQNTVPCMHAVGEVKEQSLSWLRSGEHRRATRRGAHPHEGLELADVAVRLLDADAGERLQEVAAGQDAHLQATKGQTLPLQCKDTP